MHLKTTQDYSSYSILVLESIVPALTLSGGHLILAFIKTTELVSVHQHGPEL